MSAPTGCARLDTTYERDISTERVLELLDEVRDAGAGVNLRVDIVVRFGSTSASIHRFTESDAEDKLERFGA